MSIQGINPGYGSQGFAPGPVRPREVDDATPEIVRRPEEDLAATQAAASPKDVVPTEAPQGTDPALWSVLTSEERSFFARARAMGPLTYGRGAPSDQVPGVRLGGRIDVRV